MVGERSGVQISHGRKSISIALALALGIASPIGIDLSGNLSSAVHAQAAGALKLKRFPDRIDVVVSGVGGLARVVSQRRDGFTWRARLVDVKPSARTSTVQQVALPAAGLEMIRLEPAGGSGLNLTVETRQDLQLPEPRISADGENLIVSFAGLPGRSQSRQTARLDLRRPGRVPQPVFVPPIQARATAPPVGDIAVGTMLINNRSYVNVSGPSVSLTLNNAPAKDALMSLARLGGYGFVYVGEKDDAADDQDAPGGVTMAFRNERFDRALNSVLLASGLQARLDGRTLMVGSSVSSKSFGPQMSKVFRLNQVKVDKAANYLASLGASISIINTITTTTGESASAGTSDLSDQVSQTTQKTTEVETYGSSVGPLIGLAGTTDSRLGTITLVGDPKLISTAETYLKQLDLRRRQVAVKVQILNVDLSNDKMIDSSFSARMGDTFIVSNSGTGHLNFGKYKPGTPAGTGLYGEGGSGVPAVYPSLGQVPRQRVIDPVDAAQSVVDPVVQEEAVFPPAEPGGAPIRVPLFDSQGQPIYVPNTNPTASQTLKPVYNSQGQSVYVPSTNPNAAQTLQPVYDRNGRPVYVSDSNRYQQPDNSFYAYLEAQIVSRNAKTLSEPTLLVQEGQEAEVTKGEKVVVNVEKNENDNNSNTTFTYEKETAGLTLSVLVDKIDDNGFVTMNINPTISVPVPAEQAPGADTGGVQIFNIVERALKSGSIRLRDGQTLILSGVISDEQIEEVTKWPILGDLPILGGLFRKTESTRKKKELVILVTPRVLDDEQGGTFGYGYRPGTRAGAQLLRSSP